MQAKAAPGFARPSWFVLIDLLNAFGVKTKYALASEVFAALAKSHSDFAGMSYDTLGLRGKMIASATAGATA
jgi:predicted molibdopterin-dependent oxidoreductase YjgC